MANWQEGGLQSSQSQYQTVLGEVALSHLMEHASTYGDLPPRATDGAMILQKVLTEDYELRRFMPDRQRAIHEIDQIRMDAKHAIEQANSEKHDAEMAAWRAQKEARAAVEDRERYYTDRQERDIRLHGELCQVNDRPSVTRLLVWFASKFGAVESYTSRLGLVK